MAEQKTDSNSVRTFRDPALSLWQASVHKALVDHADASDAHAAATVEHPYMAATVSALQGFTDTGASHLPTQQASELNQVGRCAKLYAELAWNKLFNPEKARQMENEIDFSTCDPFWAKCLVTYDEFVGKSNFQPYRVHARMDEFVLNCVPDSATIAVIADWGTGMDDAVVLVQQIANHFKPDILIHLGDIYYAGLPHEIDNHFLRPLAKIWPANPPLIFALDGNHDRYAGASGGYYSMIAHLNKQAGVPQPNSYFALRNNFWQFLALDTGYHDTDPHAIAGAVTFLEETEVEWHLDKIKNRGQRGTVLLSHHQLFSYLGAGKMAGRPLAVNPKLAQAFQPVFDDIALWLWGHEHNFCIFEPYSMAQGVKLPRGRCIGASAVPNFVSALSAAENLLLPASESEPPRRVPGTELRNNGTVDNHAYTILRLDGPSLTAEYYQFDSTRFRVGEAPPPETPTYVERLTAGR